MKVDVIVLAGGFARRMWPLTREVPKQLLPVAGRPMLSHTLRPLLEMDEVVRVMVSTNLAFEGQFREFLSGAGDDRVELITEPSVDEAGKLGAIGGLGHLIGKKGIERDTMVIGGDNLFEFHPREALSVFREKGMDVVAVHDVKSMDLARLYGIVDVRGDGTISEFLEKPERPPSTLAATAFYVLERQTLMKVPEYLGKGGKSDALGHFIRYLAESGPVFAWKFEGAWFDIGSIEVYREADLHFRKRALGDRP